MIDCLHSALVSIGLKDNRPVYNLHLMFCMLIQPEKVRIILGSFMVIHTSLSCCSIL